MKKHFQNLIAWLGPIGCLALMITLVALMKNYGGLMIDSITNCFKHEQMSTVDSIIRGVKYVGLLKPYKVVVSDFAEEKRVFGKKTCTLKYQYKGMAEYSVDLNKLLVSKSEDGIYTISLPEPKLEDPIAIPIEWPRLWEADGEDRSFRQLEGKIVDARIRKEVDMPKHRELAKSQAEDIIRNMLSPAFCRLEPPVNIDDIKFVWAE